MKNELYVAQSNETQRPKWYAPWKPVVPTYAVYELRTPEGPEDEPYWCPMFMIQAGLFENWTEAEAKERLREMEAARVIAKEESK